MRVLPAKKLNKLQDILHVTKKEHKKKYRLRDAGTGEPPRAKHVLNIMRKAFKIARHSNQKKLTLFDNAQSLALRELLDHDKEFHANIDCFRLLASHYEDTFFGRHDFLADPVALKKPYRPFGLEKGEMITPLQFADGIVQYGNFMKQEGNENADLVTSLGHYFHCKLEQRPVVIEMLLSKQITTKDTRFHKKEKDPLTFYEALTGKERKPGANFPTLKTAP